MADAYRLDGSVSRETVEKLEHYHALLLKWQKTINLVSPNTLDEAWDRHFQDSLQILPFCSKGAKSLIDLGSGAGFPGLVLAVARPDFCPDLSVTLVESDERKCAFLRTVSRETDTPVTLLNERIEALSLEKTPDLISARALAPLPRLLGWMHDLSVPTGIFPKGEKADQEIREAQKSWSFTLEKHQSITDPAAKILVMKGLKALAQA